MSPKYLLFLAWLGLAMVLPAADAREIPDSWPSWLKKEFRKEKKRLRDSPIDVGEGLMRTRLPGRQQGKPEAFEGGWLLTTDIGSDTVMECWLMEEAQDLAAFAVNLAEIHIENAVEANGPESGRTVWAVDAGIAGNYPWLALEWFYAVGEESNKRAGLVKVRTADLGAMTLACAHNALGFQDTFDRAFRTVVENAEVAPVEMPPFYDELFLVSIGEQNVGMIRSSLAKDEEGDTRSLVVESALLPIDAKTVSTSDSYGTTWSRPDGSVISAYNAAAENGALISELSLTQSQDGEWRVSGTVQGKEIDSVVSGDGPPMSDVRQMQIARDLQASTEEDDASLALWLPDADPTRFLPSTLTLDRERGEGHGRLQMGPMTMDAQFDEHGAMIQARFNVGATEMLLTRIWKEGVPH